MIVKRGQHLVYGRSREIERRLDEVLRLIAAGGHSTPSLAQSLGVSIPTVSRCVTALRERGHDIRAEKQADGWQYVVRKPSQQERRNANAAGLSDQDSGAARR